MMKRKGALAASLLATGIILGACGADEEPMNNDDTEMQDDMDDEMDDNDD